MFLRQSTSQVILFGPAVSISDGVTEQTALTLAQADMRLSKDGGAFAQKNAAGNATHDSDGWYNTTLDATDTATVGELILNVQQPANMLPIWKTYYVLEEAVYDAFFAASAVGIPSIPANWLTAAGIDADAITAAKIAAGAIDAATFAAGAIDATAIGTGAIDADAIATDAITAAKIATDAITAAKIAAGAIDAATFAAGAIDAAALATDAVDEIRDALLPTQNAAFTFNFLFVAASDHVTPVTGATGTAVTRSIDGAAFGAGTGTITEISNGMYEYAASAADMNGGVVTFRFTASGGTPGAADDTFVTIVTGGGV